MRYKIEWVEVDKYGNQKVSVTGVDGSKILSAELGKEYKGQNIMAGQDINANAWTSPKNGKIYLFMEKEQGEGEKPAYKPRSTPQSAISASVKQAQERTDESVNKAQTRTETSVRLSGAQRDAVLIVTTILKESPAEDNTIKEEIIKWRNWFLSDEFQNPPPF